MASVLRDALSWLEEPDECEIRMDPDLLAAQLTRILADSGYALVPEREEE